MYRSSATSRTLTEIWMRAENDNIASLFEIGRGVFSAWRLIPLDNVAPDFQAESEGALVLAPASAKGCLQCSATLGAHSHRPASALGLDGDRDPVAPSQEPGDVCTSVHHVRRGRGARPPGARLLPDLL
jgi:hypothetical protein